MSALSLAQLTTMLEAYTPSDGTFLPRLNQALARIYNMGTYRDLTVQYSLTVSQGCIRLPVTADAILHAIVDGSPVAVRSLWHDLKQVGTASNDLSWGLVDAGFSPVLRTLETATDTLYVVPSADSPTQTEFDEDEEGEMWVDVTGSDLVRRYRATSQGDIPFAGVLTFDSPITDIEAVRFSGLLDSYDIRTVAGDPETTVATVGPGSGSPRYRVFRVPNTAAGVVVHVLCKRTFIPLESNDDLTYVGNINAIKQAFLATVAEDSNDVERAQFFWGTAMQLMEEEASSTRGAAQPRVNLDPSGTGALTGLTSMM